jgi:hypothetical protein
VNLVRRILLLLPVLLSASTSVILGCRESGTPSGVTSVAGPNEVTVDYEWSEGDVPTVEVDRESLKISCRHYRVQIVDRAIALNGEKYGMVDVGDQVKITLAGKVFVNNQRRGRIYAGF